MDVERLRWLARGVQGLGEDARRVAVVLGAARGVAWESDQAERYRADLGREAAAIRRTADLLDRACAALLAHADEVQRWRGELAAPERAAASAVGTALQALGSVPRALGATVGGPG